MNLNAFHQIFVTRISRALWHDHHGGIISQWPYQHDQDIPQSPYRRILNAGFAVIVRRTLHSPV